MAGLRSGRNLDCHGSAAGFEWKALPRPALNKLTDFCTVNDFCPNGVVPANATTYVQNALDACILDNNYIGEDKYEWITVDQFVRTFTGGSNGWAMVFLAPSPPPLPWN